MTPSSSATDDLPATAAAAAEELLELRAQLEAARAELDTRERTIEALTRRVQTLLEALRLARAGAFGARSEKGSPEEAFDELENVEASDGDGENEDASTEPDEGAVPGEDERTPRPKRTPRRRALPPELPRVREVHELPEEERQCPCGCTLSEIGEERSERVDVVPARVQVIECVRKKYACRACEETVRTAPVPPSVLPKSVLTTNTAAYAIVAKYADGLPLYRLSGILERHGIALSRQTLSGAVLRTAAALEPLIETLAAHLHEGLVMHIDETRVQVLNEPGRAPQSQSYMWVQRGGPPGRTVVRFAYEPSRAAVVPERLIGDYAGAVMTDGYEVYRRVARDGTFVHLVCWAHARRKFVEAKKAQPKGRSGKADAALSLIGKLYGIERACAGSDAAQRHRTRAERAVPVLAELEAWLERSAATVAPKGALGRAIGYAREYWTELVRYVENGAWPIDNNAVENAIRPFVIGRKAWLFSASERGAKASAGLYSLIETARANGREPYGYLCWLLERIPGASTEADLDALMPWNAPPSAIAPT